MAFSVDRARREIVRALRERGHSEGDPKLQDYLGSPLPILGVASKDLRAVVRDFAKDHPDLAPAALNRLAPALWRGRTFEERVFAIDLYVRYRRIRDDRSWRILDRWVGEATGWGLCDHLASHPVSEMVFERRSRLRELRRWTRSDHLWRRRAVAYATARFVRAGELDAPLELLERLLYDPEFWVQRGVGTWLRECWKKDGRRVESFLRERVKGLPRVTITVATERASRRFREELRRNRG